MNDNIRLSFVISHDDINTLESNLKQASNFNFPLIRQTEATTGLDGQILASMTLSPRTTNEASFAFKKYNVNLLLKDDGAPAVRPAGLTIKDFFSGANTLNLAPGLTFSGGFSSAGTSQLPLMPATDDNYIVSDNFSHIIGRHTLQAGRTWFHYTKTQALFNSTQGTYSFTGAFTNDPVADFMLGLAKTYTQGKERFTRTYGLNQTEWYLQDDWRVSRRLTLNLGMRLFFMPPVHEAQDRVDSFVPSKFDPSKAPIVTQRRSADPDSQLRSGQRTGIGRSEWRPARIRQQLLRHRAALRLRVRSVRQRQDGDPRRLRHLVPQHRQRPQCRRLEHQSSLQPERQPAERVA